jgi:protein-S-isoprenylcysteine O-methyltransferase Ste14
MSPKLPPLALTLLLAALMWGAARASPQFLFQWPYAPGLAAAIALVGLVICLLGVASFRRAGTTVNPTRPDGASTLVVRGIYRHSRNPMYLGFLLCLAAWGIYLSHAPALLGGPLLLVLYLNRFQIVPEERVLEARFGGDYRAYRKAVRRWL